MSHDVWDLDVRADPTDCPTVLSEVGRVTKGVYVPVRCELQDIRSSDYFSRQRPRPYDSEFGVEAGKVDPVHEKDDFGVEEVDVSPLGFLDYESQQPPHTLHYLCVQDIVRGIPVSKNRTSDLVSYGSCIIRRSYINNLFPFW